MKNTLTLILCTVALFSANAQNPGYFNRKNVLEFSVNAQTPIFANLFTMSSAQFKKVEGDRLVEKKDYFDYGFRFAYMHTFKRDFGMGLEFGYDYFSVQREDRYVNNWDSYTQTFEKMEASSMMIMPKIEFSNKGSVLPMGISHQLGWGVRFVKPIDKPYHYVNTAGYYIPGTTNELIKIPGSYKGKAVRGMTLMYAVNVRTPLSKRLFLNYGVRYTLNMMSKSTYYDSGQVDNDDPYLSEAEFRNIARRRKQFSLIQANIGVSFAF